ncbi:unnamed protein product [Closterium sp. NIES-54]
MSAVRECPSDPLCADGGARAVSGEAEGADVFRVVPRQRDREGRGSARGGRRGGGDHAPVRGGDRRVGREGGGRGGEGKGSGEGGKGSGEGGKGKAGRGKGGGEAAKEGKEREERWGQRRVGDGKWVGQ